MIGSRLRFGLIMLAGASLIACGKTSESDALDGDPFAMTGARGESKFGTGFAEVHRADPNSEPAEVSDDDVAPISLTTEPVAID